MKIKQIKKFKYRERIKKRHKYRRMSKIIGIKPVKGNKISFYSNGDRVYDSMLEEISKAKKNINLGTYIFNDDIVGKVFKKALIKKAKTGIKINIIYDAIGSRKTHNSFIKEMKESGIELIKYHTILSRKILKANQRYHMKLLIIDGKVGFIGGMNISQNYAGKKYQGYLWRDLMTKIEGPAVGDMQTMFLITWLKESNKPIKDELFYFPKLPAKGNTNIVVIGNQFYKGHIKLRNTFISLCENAEKSIYIESAYFLPDNQIRKALREAKKRGVDVKIIIPRNTDFKPLYYARRATYCKSLTAGIEIYEYFERTLHTKLAIFDNQSVVIGSANFDYRSFFLNVEGSIIIEGEKIATEATTVFLHDLQTCDKVNINKFKARPFFIKLIEKILFLFRHLL